MKMVRTKFSKKKTLNMPIQGKPEVQLIGMDTNVFLLLGACEKALRKAHQYDEAKKMRKKVLAAYDFDNAVCIMMDYCNIT